MKNHSLCNKNKHKGNDENMKQLKKISAVVCLLLAVILGCSIPEESSRPEQLLNKQTSNASPNTISEIDRVLLIPTEFKPVYKAIKVEDVSSPLANRKTIHVSLPMITDNREIENNLRFAAKEYYEKEKFDALQIIGYLENRSIDSSNVLGTLTFAPYGDWGKASEKASLDKYKAVFKERNPYLPPIGKEPNTNDIEKKALAGDYLAQRNLAYYLSTGADGHSTNPILGCAWRIVILKSKHAKADATDTNDKSFYCDRKLDQPQLKQAEAEADSLLKKIKKH
jgi:hypothetical protein